MPSKNKPHEIISGAGWLVQFASGVFDGLHERGVDDDTIHRLGTSVGMEDMERGIAAFVDAIAPRKDTEYLRHLTRITLAPTPAADTLAEARDIFTGLLDIHFEDWGTNIPGEDTDEVTIDVYEMSKNGDYRTLFGSLPGDLRNRVMTQGQVREFCKTHREWLRQEGHGTFFLFEVNGERFVAGVGVDDGGLRANVGRFDDVYVWLAGCRHRLVVQQQTI